MASAAGAACGGYHNGSDAHSRPVAPPPPKPRGDRKNKTRKRRTSAPARKKKYVRTFFIFIIFLVRFWAFLGKESSKTREKELSTFQKKNRGNIFSGADFFLGDFFNSFIFHLFIEFLVALVKHLSVRGTQKRD
jgi:hypothetical protein